MNYLRTAILLAGLTGLFMAVGYLIGGGSGALIALIIAAGTNLFSYWNADRLVLSMHDAGGRRAQRAGTCGDRARAGAARRPTDAAALSDGQPTTQCLCHRTQSATRRSLRDDRATYTIWHVLPRQQSRQQ